MYLQEFKSNDDIIHQFNAPSDALDGAEVLLAWYGYGSYCGSAYVLWRRDGVLYENHGAHCSCYGLEDQWAPEEVSVHELIQRNLGGDDYYDGSSEAQKALEAVIATL
jgi:hypothetical protein